MSDSRNGLVTTVAVCAAVLGLIVGGLGVFFFVPARQAADMPASEPSQDCTLIGAEGGVNIGIPTASVKAGSEIVVSINDGSETAISSRTTVDDAVEEQFVRIPVEYDKDTELTITLTYTDASGAEKTVTTKANSVLVEPNGPNCGPSVYQVNLDLQGDTLVALKGE